MLLLGVQLTNGRKDYLPVFSIILFGCSGSMVTCKGLRVVLAHVKYTKTATSNNASIKALLALKSHSAFKILNSH